MSDLTGDFTRRCHVCPARMEYRDGQRVDTFCSHELGRAYNAQPESCPTPLPVVVGDRAREGGVAAPPPTGVVPSGPPQTGHTASSDSDDNAQAPMTLPPEDADAFEPKPHSEWGWTDWWTEALCRAVGCGSVVHPWRGIGYRFVCNPLHLWLFDRDERKEVRRG